MKAIKAGVVAAALIGISLFALSSVSMSAQQSPKFESAFGATLPPVGYVRFCARNPADCKPINKYDGHLQMTAKLWEVLYTLNTRINTAIAPTSDQDLYGVPEFWAYPQAAGDCEDYVLQKQKELGTMGVPSGNLLITVVRDEKGDGHAVLTISTAQGDFIMDNRRNDIRAWNDTGYKFLKRQSAQDPKAWVALTTASSTNVTSVAGSK
jgi:predicted transglutaminase-like cysteine proteinase